MTSEFNKVRKAELRKLREERRNMYNLGLLNNEIIPITEYKNKRMWRKNESEEERQKREIRKKEKLDKHNNIQKDKEIKYNLKMKMIQERLDEKVRIQNLKLFNLPEESQRYYDLVEEQGGLCIICHIRPRTILVQDHDHRCCIKGNGCKRCRRGLLCYKCNLALGLVNDSPLVLKAMIDYLLHHSNKMDEYDNGKSQPLYIQFPLLYL